MNIARVSGRRLVSDRRSCRRSRTVVRRIVVDGETSEPRAPTRLHRLVRDVRNISERCACRALGQHRSTQRKAPRGGVGQGPRPAEQAGVARGGRDGEEELTADLVELARQYGRCGYRKSSALLQDAGWVVNDKRADASGAKKG